MVGLQQNVAPTFTNTPAHTFHIEKILIGHQWCAILSHFMQNKTPSQAYTQPGETKRIIVLMFKQYLYYR